MGERLLEVCETVWAEWVGGASVFVENGPGQEAAGEDAEEEVVVFR